MEISNINNIKKIERKTAITVGMFDGLHIGHRQIIRHLLEMADPKDLMPVVVTFENHPRSVLHPDEPMPMLTTFDERMALLEACGVEHLVLVTFDRSTAQMSACQFAEQLLCKRLNMRQLLLGYDNLFGNRANNDFDRLPALGEEMGFAIVHDSPVCVGGVDVSSTKIRKALLAGDIENANSMLGTPYSLSGRVEHGRHVGTLLGFPTANISIDDNAKLLPADGVYALRASVGGSSYPAMANLGGQPTFGTPTRTLEVNIINFDGDLYGQVIKVDFLARMRDIQHFADTETLKQQLIADREKAILNFEF